ncbi:putative resolvase [Pseudoalteromonas virus vB_PspP-H6/1]|nr:putative resolvase [Pseudoalteromonas virus vB_PspP-H6/1]
MKASELIYRLARAIEARGDLPVTMSIEADVIPEQNFCAEVMSLDVNTNTYGFEIYGEEK